MTSIHADNVKQSTSRFPHSCDHNTIFTTLCSEGMFHHVLIDGCINEEVSMDCLVKTLSIVVCGWLLYSLDKSAGLALVVQNSPWSKVIPGSKVWLQQVMRGRLTYFMMPTTFSQIGRSNVTIVTLSAESCMHSLRVVKMLLWSLGSSLMTGRKSICMFCLTLSAWILFIQPFQDQLGCEKPASWAWITHPASQCVSPGVRSGWLCVTEEESSMMGRNVMEFIPICFLLVNGRIFTSAHTSGS